MNKQDKLQRAQGSYTPQQPFGEVRADQLQQLAALKKTAAPVQRLAAGKLLLHRCEATAAGLIVPSDLTRQELYDLAVDLFAMESSVALWVGDMLVAVESLGYGDISQIALEFNRAPKTLSNWKAVCAAVETSLRREVVAAFPDRRPLTFGHYALLVTLPASAQFEAASRAIDAGWSIAQLRDFLHPQKEAPRAAVVEKYRERLWNGVEDVRRKFHKSKRAIDKRAWLSLASEQAQYWQDLVTELKKDL